MFIWLCLNNLLPARCQAGNIGMVEDWKENRSFWKGLPIFHHSIVPVSQFLGSLLALIKAIRHRRSGFFT